MKANIYNRRETFPQLNLYRLKLTRPLNYQKALDKVDLVEPGQVVIEQARKKAYVKRTPIKIEDNKGLVKVSYDEELYHT
ncbi:MAG: hypothetical protein ACJ70Y_05195 [Nitrososphaera sp.]